jgi:hypothetical protein
MDLSKASSDNSGNSAAAVATATCAPLKSQVKIRKTFRLFAICFSGYSLFLTVNTIMHGSGALSAEITQ